MAGVKAIKRYYFVQRLFSLAKAHPPDSVLVLYVEPLSDSLWPLEGFLPFEYIALHCRLIQLCK